MYRLNRITEKISSYHKTSFAVLFVSKLEKNANFVVNTTINLKVLTLSQNKTKFKIENTNFCPYIL